MHHDFTLFFRLVTQVSTKSQFSLLFSIAVHLVSLKDDDEIRMGLRQPSEVCQFLVGGLP